MDLITELLSLCPLPHLATRDTREQYTKRLKLGSPTRDENPESHFCVYFLPYNSTKKNVFIVHHKKSGLWLAPGGHIDEGESSVEALCREVSEELGVNVIQEPIEPFLLTITPINNPGSRCKMHYDIWYRLDTDGSGFRVDQREFLATRWLSIPEARRIVTDSPNLQALEIVSTV